MWESPSWMWLRWKLHFENWRKKKGKVFWEVARYYESFHVNSHSCEGGNIFYCLTSKIPKPSRIFTAHEVQDFLYLRTFLSLCVGNYRLRWLKMPVKRLNNPIRLVDVLFRIPKLHKSLYMLTDFFSHDLNSKIIKTACKSCIIATRSILNENYETTKSKPAEEKNFPECRARNLSNVVMILLQEA